MKHNGENRVLLQHFINDIESAIKCIDYRGRQLWKIRKQPLGGIVFQPWDACTDNSGHVFTADLQRNRIVVINPDTNLEVLTQVPGMVTSLGWCDITYKLYIGYKNASGTHMLMSRFNITDQWHLYHYKNPRTLDFCTCNANSQLSLDLSPT